MKNNKNTGLKSLLQLRHHLFPWVFFLMLGFSNPGWGQTVLLDPSGEGGFENGTTLTANGWTAVNQANNYWVVGTATSYTGRAAYISTNGTNNSYNIGTTQTSHIYRDITVPSGEENIILSFYLHGSGEVDYDRLLVYTAPTTITPVAGTPVSHSTTLTGATLVYTQTAMQATFSQQLITLPAALAGTTFRLIFTWQNDDNTGSDPPVAVDNISVTSGKFRYLVADGYWNVTSSWSSTSGGTAGASVPVAGDVVYIEGGYTVTVTEDAACQSVTFTGTGSILTVNSIDTLAVSGAVTMNSNANTDWSNSITGAGTLTCSSIAVGTTVTPSGGTKTTTMTSAISILTISGNLTLSSFRSNSNYNNPAFYLQSGTLNVDGSIITSNANSSNTSTFSMASGDQTGTLFLGGTTPFSVSGTGTSTITLAGTSTTINYYRAGNQTARVTTYRNLTLSNSGIKTFSTTPTVNGILSMEGTATVTVTTGVVTYGTNATLQYNTATARNATSEEWITPFAATGGVIIANTGAITLNANKVFNASVPLTISSGASLNTNVTNNRSLTFGGDFHNNGGTFTANASPIVIANTMATQSIDGFTTTGLVSMTKTAGTATFTENVNGGGLTINGNGGTLNLGSGLIHTFTGTWTRTAGILNGGSSTLKLGSGFSSTVGTFTAGTGTVEWYKAGTQTVAAVAYNNLTLSGSGAKSIASGTSVTGNLSISGATASVGSLLNISVGSLTLGGFNKINGTWGSTTSTATNKDNAYFAATTGLVTVTTDTRPTPGFSGLTASQNICYSTATVTLSGIVSAAGPVYPANGETVGVTINGVTQNASISGGAGGFSISFNTATVPASGTPYTITYAYGGNVNMKAAEDNTSTTLTVSTIPTITGTTPGSVCGTGTVTLGATASAGTINWFTTSSGGSSQGTGTTFTTPGISVSTTYYVEAINGGCTSATRTPVLASIIHQASITAGGGGTFCSGSDVTLVSSGTNITNQYWLGPNSFYSLSQNPILSNAIPAMTGTYTVTGSALSGINLVTNGDFESGNTGFGSSYTASTDLNQEGRYAIVADPHSVHTGFTNCADHSSYGTLQMVVNGAIISGVNVWSQTVNVVAGTDYQFTYWVQSVVAGNPSQLQLYVNTFAAGPVYTALTPTCQWTQFTYNWNSGSSTTAYLSLVNQNIIAGGNDFALDDIVFQQACSATASVNVTINSDGIWTGTVSSDWNVPGNWSCSVPTATTDVTISSGGNQPVIRAAAVCKNITIYSGAVLTIGAGAGLTVNGILTNNEGASGLILQSDATGTASLIHNTNNVPATIKRYISGTTEAWHFLSSPVTAQSISGTWLPSGTYGNGTGYDLYLWDEATSCWIYKLNTTSTVNWNTVHPGSSFAVGRGYLYSVQATNPTKQFAGNLNNGNQSIALTSTGPIDTLAGFNLVGNPYPSSVDWQAASGWTRTNLVASGSGYDMWTWNPAANNYGVINSATGTGTNGVTRYIAPMQGFFVQTVSAGNMLMDNTVRVLNGAGSWLKKGTGYDINMVSITVNSETGVGFDEVQLIYGSKQNEAGARKLFSPALSAPSLFLPLKGENVSMRYLTDTVDNPVIPVMFKPGMDGEYTLQCTFDLSQFETLILEDHQLHLSHDLKAENGYKFKASKTDDQSRFVLHFAPFENTDNIELPAGIYTAGNRLIIDMATINGETEVVVCDIMGRLLLRKKLQGETKHEISLNSQTQMLIVCLKNQKGMVCKKLMWVNE